MAKSLLLAFGTLAAVLLVPRTAQARDGFLQQLMEARLTLGGAPVMIGSVPVTFLFFALISLAALAFVLFWILMVIDCLRRRWPQRMTWLVALIASLFVSLHWLAALLYYFLVKRKGVGDAASGGSAAKAGKPDVPSGPAA